MLINDDHFILKVKSLAYKNELLGTDQNLHVWLHCRGKGEF